MSARSSLLERLTFPLLVLAGTHLVGTVGYRVLWHDLGGTWLDALFMTFTTITTIGFGEVKPLDGPARLLTMLVALGGIGSLFYTFTVILDFVTSGEVRSARRSRIMQRTIDSMSDHFIVAGVGRVGHEAAAELRDSGHAFILVDPAEHVVQVASDLKVPYIRGDASEDATLERAGIRRAKGIVVTTASDATNLYVVLSARLLNPKLFIAARVDEDSAVPKLQRAGADRVINPYATGGRRLAHLLLSPRTVDFFETALRRGTRSLSIDEILITESSKAAGRTLADLDLGRQTGVTVLAVLRDGETAANPHGTFTLSVGDHLLVLGTDEQLARSGELLAS